MENYIDFGIDFGAENIVVVAIGYDKLGRSDYKLVSLHPSGSVKNYIGERKTDNKIEIGNDVKIAYVYKDTPNDYNWICGRYKAYVAEENYPFFEKNPGELLKYGLEEIIKKIETYDFTPFLTGSLRNITVGVPQSWGFHKRLLYREIMSMWKHGNVTLLSEPVAATIAAYKRSSSDIANNIIMILDMGASTFDVSFAKYSGPENRLDVYKTTYRSEFAGHYFDTVFAAFALMSDVNKLPANEIIDRVSKLKLKGTEDYIQYLNANQSKYSELLLDIETIKENHLLEIVKFNRKKLLDINKKTPVTISKQIYNDALRYYSEKISGEINQVISNFKNNENPDNSVTIYPFLCGGASSLYGLEKSLREKINGSEKERLFSILKEGQGSKIDTTIAIGLAYYAQDKSIIAKKLEYSIGVSLPVDEDSERKDFWILQEGDEFPLEKDRELSNIIDSTKELQYHGTKEGKISFPVLQKSSLEKNKIHTDIISISMESCEKGDSFDILLNIDIDGIISITVKNISKNISIRKNLSLKNNHVVDGGLLVV